MKYITRVISGPTVEPVVLYEVKEHLRIDHQEHDDMLEGLIQSSREHIEALLGRALVQQTRAVEYQDWPSGDVIEIPFSPIQSVTHVKYTDTDGTEHTLSTDDYSVDTDAEPGRVVLGYNKTWPSDTLHGPDYPIVITYVAGYDTDGNDYRSDIPETIKTAIKLDVERHYDRPPEPYGRRLDNAIDGLLARHRLWSF